MMSTPSRPVAAIPSATSLVSDGFVTGVPRVVLRIEGAVMLATSSVAYARLDGGWAMFALLFLVPDVSMLGYLAGRRIGSISYNLVHSYVPPAALGAMGVLLADHIVRLLALIWVAHIGFDRMLGYGLKYATAFRHTHLGIVGKARD